MAFIPSIAPQQITKDGLFLMSALDRKVTVETVSGNGKETIGSADSNGRFTLNAKSTTLSIHGKQAQKMFDKTMIDKDVHELVRLGWLLESDIPDFLTWQSIETKAREYRKEKQAEKRASRPVRELSAQEKADREEKAEKRKQEKLILARELAKKLDNQAIANQVKAQAKTQTKQAVAQAKQAKTSKTDKQATTV